VIIQSGGVALASHPHWLGWQRAPKNATGNLLGNCEHLEVQLRRKTGIVVSTSAAVCRAKWNAYTEDQLLHNGQGQGRGQYWEEHLKQVGARHAVQQRIPGKSAVLNWNLYYT
jgi:hypothetical protein